MYMEVLCRVEHISLLQVLLLPLLMPRPSGLAFSI